MLGPTLTLPAFAKINLSLLVLGKRPDGYHELDTVLQTISLHDTIKLTVTDGPEIVLSCDDRSLPTGADNLVYLAAESLQTRFAPDKGVRIRLEKRIPLQAGLGGGSSDAASTLIGLCRLYRVSRKANQAKLHRLASGLGSDVPFFLLESPLAAATGRGEKLKPLAVRGKMPGVVIVYPGRPAYTKEAFGRLRLAPEAGIKSRLAGFRKIVRDIADGHFTPERAGLFNRLEETVLPLHREVRLAKDRLQRAGAGAALMSGSGSAVFALVREPGQARRIAAAIKCNRSYKVFFSILCVYYVY